MRGVKVMVSAGRTEEPLDPVRVITNRSSGRMGVALAEAARDRGAEVALVAGAMSVEPPAGVRVVAVSTAAEMERAVLAEARRADLVVMAAAVADYRPARAEPGKIQRGAERMTLELEPNPDILARAAAARRPGQVFVGFALELAPGMRRAREKLAAKRLDLVVLNDPREAIGRETNRVTLVEARASRRFPELPKREAADRILDRALELWGQRRRRPAEPAGRRPVAARGTSPRRAARKVR